MAHREIKTLSEAQSKAILALVTEEERSLFLDAFTSCDKNRDGNISTKVIMMMMMIMMIMIMMMIMMMKKKKKKKGPCSWTHSLVVIKIYSSLTLGLAI